MFEPQPFGAVRFDAGVEGLTAFTSSTENGRGWLGNSLHARMRAFHASVCTSGLRGCASASRHVGFAGIPPPWPGSAACLKLGGKGSLLGWACEWVSLKLHELVLDVHHLCAIVFRAVAFS